MIGFLSLSDFSDLELVTESSGNNAQRESPSSDLMIRIQCGALSYNHSDLDNALEDLETYKEHKFKRHLFF